MIKKFQIAVLMVTLGFYLMPMVTFACETESSKSCCDKEMSSSKMGEMDCCKNANHSKEKQNHKSDRKTNHSTCNCFVFHINVILPFETQSKVICLNFLDKKDKFNEKETNLSSGFHSIWLIPKIS